MHNSKWLKTKARTQTEEGRKKDSNRISSFGPSSYSEVLLFGLEYDYYSA